MLTSFNLIQSMNASFVVQLSFSCPFLLLHELSPLDSFSRKVMPTAWVPLANRNHFDFLLMRNENGKEPFLSQLPKLDALARKSIPVAASLPIMSYRSTGRKSQHRVTTCRQDPCTRYASLPHRTFPAPNHYAHVLCASAVQSLSPGRMLLRVVMRLKPPM